MLLEFVRAVAAPAKNRRVDRPVPSVLADGGICASTRTTEDVPSAPVDPSFAGGSAGA